VYKKRAGSRGPQRSVFKRKKNSKQVSKKVIAELMSAESDTLSADAALKTPGKKNRCKEENGKKRQKIGK